MASYSFQNTDNIEAIQKRAINIIYSLANEMPYQTKLTVQCPFTLYS